MERTIKIHVMLDNAPVLLGLIFLNCLMTITVVGSVSLCGVLG